MVGLEDLLAKLGLNLWVEGEVPETERQGVPGGLIASEEHQEERCHDEELDLLYRSRISILIKTAWPVQLEKEVSDNLN